MKKIWLVIIAVLTVFGATANSTRVAKVLRDSVLIKAQWAMGEEPITVTATLCPRSAGGAHDFYSEGDYWWPDPKNPNAPYIRRDGETNPENFIAHREAMIRLSEIVGALGSAYILTLEQKYVSHAMRHIEAWFVNPATMMNPNLLYAQAIKGVATGRGIGIIDTIHLMEVTQALIIMADSPATDRRIVAATKRWFDNYLEWLTTHEYGIKEMNAANNHGTCWAMQAAAFARLTGNSKITEQCREIFTSRLLPGQLADDGSFPLEMARTKPYGYSLFNFDAMAVLCQILSNKEHNLWNVPNKNGHTMRDAADFIAPFIARKSSWPLPPDVMYWEQWPVAQPGILFAALHYNDSRLLELWQHFDHFPTNSEVVRNLPIRNPLLWL